MLRKVVIVGCVIVFIFLIILGVLFFLTRSVPTPGESVIIQKAREFFPFGQPSRNPDDLFPGDGQATSPDGQTPGQNLDTALVPRLRKIHNEPTAGSEVWLETKPKTKEKILHIEYVDRATGHVFQTESNSLVTEKISNTTLPKMYEAAFANQNAFISRFLDDINNDDIIKTFLISLKDKPLPVVATSTASTTVEIAYTPKESVGTYLEDNIKEISFSPSKTKILYSLYEGDGGALIVSNPNGTNKRKIYSGILREWLLSWINDSTAVMASKPSGYTTGYAYKINTQTGAMTKLVGNLIGLTVLPKPNSSTLFLIGTGGQSLNLSVLNTTSKSPDRLYISRTLPEKCAWSKKEAAVVFCAVPIDIPQGAYPDDWYQGKVSFTDTFWKINTDTAQTNLLFIPENESAESIDATNLEVSDDDTYLTFINKKNLSLWGYQLVVPPPLVATSSVATTTVLQATSTVGVSATTTR